MAQLTISIDSDLPRLLAYTNAVSRSMRPLVAQAMTHGSRRAERAIKAQAPRYIDRPTRWTMNSIFVKPATPTRLETAVGFKDYAVKGTPAAKYLEPMVSGRRRGPKGSENLLRRTQVIPPGSFITPTGVKPLLLNQYGNISGAKMVQVLSRLSSLREAGYTANVSKSRRSQSKRAQSDYFTGQPGSLPYGIYARLGKKPKGTGGPGGTGGRAVTSNLPRGFHTVFNVVRQAPKYEPTFPADKILERTFASTYSSKLARLLDDLGRV